MNTPSVVQEKGEWVYVIGYCGKKRPCKVGKTNNLLSRFSSIKGCCAEKLEIKFACKFSNKDIKSSVEKKAHRQLKKSKIHGEWFDLSAGACAWNVLTIGLLEEAPAGKYSLDVSKKENEINVLQEIIDSNNGGICTSIGGWFLGGQYG